jgi:hypothetical protein
LVSTPNGKDQLYYGIYSKALRGENNFHIIEFKWFQDLRYNRNLRWYRQNQKTGEYEWDVDTVIDKKGNVVYDEVVVEAEIAVTHHYTEAVYALVVSAPGVSRTDDGILHGVVIVVGVETPLFV